MNFSVAAGSDQTTGDTVSVINFESLDASALSTALTVTGTATANTITTGSGDDVIHGGGGADVIVAGAGNDSVDYNGSETSIDGGANTDTLVLKVAATVDLTASDQTTGDGVNVSHFENVDGSALSGNLTITGTTSANAITTGSGDDTIHGGGGADVIVAGGGNDTVDYNGAETSINGGTGTNTLVLGVAATVDLSSADQTSGDSTNVSNFQNVDASAVSTGLTLTGSGSANTITGGSGDDTINGNGGLDHLFGGSGDDLFLIDGSSLSLGTQIDGGSGTNTVNIAAGSGTITDSELLASLTNVQSIDFTASSVNASLTLSAAQISQIDGGAAKTLTLNVNTGDNLTISDAPANYDTVVAGNTTTYTLYDDSLHSHLVANLAVITH